MLMKFKMRRGCTFPSPLTWPSTKKSNGTDERDNWLNGWLQRLAGDQVGVQSRLCVDPHWFYLNGVPLPLRELS